MTSKVMLFGLKALPFASRMKRKTRGNNGITKSSFDRELKRGIH